MCCSFRTCAGCSLAPLSVAVLLAALLIPQIPQLSPKHSPCQADVNGVCKHSEAGGPAPCDAGVFVQLTKQPRLGLRHATLSDAPDGLAFASLTAGGCTATYSAKCGTAGVVIEEFWSCAGKRAAPAAALGKQWEVCAKGAELRLLGPVTDLSFDVQIDAGTTVIGCIAISAPRAFPHLDVVRGTRVQQKEALVARKAAIGGCPTWQNKEDRMARSWDFEAQYGLPAVFAAQFHLTVAEQFAQEYKTAVIKESRWKNVFVTASLAITLGGEPSLQRFASEVNCGSPTFSLLPVPGITVTRHADVARLMADKTQRRDVIIGGGYSEACFERSLPVFLSTGSPEHTQVRKLWDACGLVSMHEGEIPEPHWPVHGALGKAKAALIKATTGVETPLLDELSPIVTELFLEKLWGRKPTPDQVATISAYATFGGPCIVGHLTMQLPFLPGKVKAIRAEALDFAKGSPVGKAMLEEIQKPAYKELRALYAANPKGVGDSALQNLADASLFAGLVGTSTLTMNCLLQVSRGPEYVKMFRSDPASFLQEVMRTATAVGGSTQVNRQPWNVTVGFEQLLLPEGAYIVQTTGLAAGMDASVFPEPATFDSRRPNLGEAMNWNGLNKYVFAQDYAGAPRHCPGAKLSVKIATKICGHYSSHMKER